jgi:hypothetical protein
MGGGRGNAQENDLDTVAGEEVDASDEDCERADLADVSCRC